MYEFMMKRMITCLLVLVMLTSLALPGYADTQTLAPEDVEALMEVYAGAAEELEELESAAALAGGFRGFINVIQPVGTVLTFINGSVAFLRLLGVIDDPDEEREMQILNELTHIDEQMQSMDSKLNDIITQMQEMQATIEFNYRADKAYNMRQSWRDFTRDYEENGIDALMTQYSAMLADGMMAWCDNKKESDRASGGVDDTQIVVLYDYDEQSGTYRQSFSDVSASSISADCPRYAVLKADCLPDSFTYRADSFRDDLVQELAANIKNQLDAENYDAFDARNYPMLTAEGKDEVSEEAILALAEEAVDALIYRIGCAKVNESADFAYAVDRAFTYYCTHLLSSEEGIDAMFKSLYLTHSFEFETKEDLRDFSNRMLVKTGAYGLFALNVLGMSHAADSSMKTAAIRRFYDTGMALADARENCLTGNDRYCYLTNTEVRYIELYLSENTTINTYQDATYKNFESYSTSGFKRSTYGKVPDTASFIGEAKYLLLSYTLQSEGHKFVLGGGEGSLHEYLSEHVTEPSELEKPYFGRLVLNVGQTQTLPIDRSVQLMAHNAIGEYFDKVAYRLTLKDLPEDAEEEYIRYRREILGTVYDMGSGVIKNNMPLQAVAVYGETHWTWFTDEAAYMGGPVDYPNYNAGFNWYETAFHKYRYDFSSMAKYNTLVILPADGELSESDGYHPLNAFRELSAALEEEAVKLTEPTEELALVLDEGEPAGGEIDRETAPPTTTPAAEKAAPTGDDSLLAVWGIMLLLGTAVTHLFCRRRKER